MSSTDKPTSDDQSHKFTTLEEYEAFMLEETIKVNNQKRTSAMFTFDIHPDALTEEWRVRAIKEPIIPSGD